VLLDELNLGDGVMGQFSRLGDLPLRVDGKHFVRSLTKNLSQ
jgi:hypothetical protein